MAEPLVRHCRRSAHPGPFGPCPVRRFPQPVEGSTTEGDMVDDAELIRQLRRHWEYSGRDEDISHEIYHEDAVLEFPQSGERFEGITNFREWRRQYPAWLQF